MNRDEMRREAAAAMAAVKDAKLAGSRRSLNQTARVLDLIWNGAAAAGRDKTYGFLFVVYPFAEGPHAKANYVSNTARSTQPKILRRVADRLDPAIHIRDMEPGDLCHWKGSDDMDIPIDALDRRRRRRLLRWRRARLCCAFAGALMLAVGAAAEIVEALL